MGTPSRRICIVSASRQPPVRIWSAAVRAGRSVTDCGDILVGNRTDPRAMIVPALRPPGRVVSLIPLLALSAWWVPLNALDEGAARHQVIGG